MTKKIYKASFYLREDNPEAEKWKLKIEEWLKNDYPEIEISSVKPDVVIVLGGDGTIIEACRKYSQSDTIILGVNLGRVGFISSINNPEDFKEKLTKFLNGEYKLNPGMIIQARVIRDGRSVFVTEAFNEVVVQSPLGMVEIEVGIDGDMVEEIRGTGVLVSTPSGSTAYNLSAHGPIVTPDIECLIITELFDHDLPTPSLVIPSKENIKLIIKSFREHKILKLTSTNETVDVL
ncbi:MAG: NAD(+)/NADH kinase, partial [Parcubacteria group bacterium]